MRALRVSVLIPSYDRAVLLRTRSIPSVMRQSYPHWELIVIGDGPPDDALRRVVEGFGDPRMTYVEIRRPDYGRLSTEAQWRVAGAEARNHGLTLATGDVLAPLDDDDEFLPDHLLDCVGAIAGGEADLVYGPVIVRDIETGREYEDYFPWQDPANRDLFARRNILFHSSVCYSRRLAHVAYPTDGELAADYGLWRRLHDAGARFTSVPRRQSIYYGSALTSSVRVTIPSLVSPDQYQECVTGVLASGVVTNGGPWCQKLEHEVARYLGVPSVVAAASGDAALIMACSAIHQRDQSRREVIVPSYTFPSTVNAILWNRFLPVFADIDPRTLCLSAATVEPLINADTAAIMAVHTHGNPCDMVGLETLARERGIVLLADAASAFGASIGDRRIGSFGDMEVFSFSGTKVLTAGEGGLVSCPSTQFAGVVRRAGRYGIDDSYVCDIPGVNGKLAELPAALACCNLPLVPQWQERRMRAVDRYRSLLGGVPLLRFQEQFAPGVRSTWKDFPLILASSELARYVTARLAAYRIQSRPYYRPLHRMRRFASLGRSPLPETDHIADAVVCVPLYADIRDEVVALVADVVHEACVTYAAREPWGAGANR